MQQQTNPPSSSLFIGNLHVRTTEETIRTLFEQYGHVVSVHFLPMTQGKKNQCCFVNYRTVEEATRAKEAMNNEVIDMHMIDISYGKSKQPRRPERQTKQQQKPKQTITTQKIPIPLQSYYMNETISFQMYGNDYQISLTPNVREGKQFKIVSGGNETIIELEIELDNQYERRGDDLIHHVHFDRQYQGITSEIRLTKINGDSIVRVASINEGTVIELPLQGFLRSDGSRGVYYFIIHLC